MVCDSWRQTELGRQSLNCCRPSETEPWDGSDTDRAKQLLGDAAKEAGVKKGIVMKSLRAALLGRLQGPDLITTWSLLARIGRTSPGCSVVSPEDVVRLIRLLRSVPRARANG